MVRQKFACGGGFAENGRNQRHIGTDIRCHHHHLTRRNAAGQRIEQGIAQHFQFALTGMAGMHAQGGIGQFGGSIAFRCHQIRLQLPNAFLQALQTIDWNRFVLVLPVPQIIADRPLGQLTEKMLTQAAPACQQCMVQFLPILTLAGRLQALLFFAAIGLPVRGRTDFQAAPIFLTGVGNIQRHHGLFGIGPQHLQLYRCQMAETKDMQHRPFGSIGFQGRAQFLHGVPAVAAEPALHRPPQGAQQFRFQGLTAGIAEFSGFPGLQPIRPVDDILRVDARQAIG